MNVGRPPRVATWLLRVVLPRDERDFVLGDLAEEFDTRTSESGRVRAALWYWGESMRSLWPLLTYDTSSWEGMMNGLEKDVSAALRIFRRAPGFGAIVVLTLAIGVGGTTAVYSVIKGVLLSPMAFEDSDRVVMLWGQSAEYPRTPLTVGDHNVLANQVDAFEDVTAAWGNTALILGESEAEQVSVGWVTPEYFDVLGVQPALGRAIEANELNVTLISHALWVRRYGADPNVLGRTIDLSGESFEVVGVLPPDQDPNLTTFGGSRSTYSVWRLQPPDWTQGDDRSVGWLRSTARLRDGVTLAQAQAEVDAVFTNVNATITERDGGTDMRVNLIPVRADLVGGLTRTLWILFAAVCGVLLIAATNIAHLLLGQGELRSEEMAVRAALGGSRPRILRQLLVESGVLAAVGGIVGIGVAWWGVKGLLVLAPETLPRLEQVRMDWGVLAFALAATATAAILFSIVPAIRTTRTDLPSALGERRATPGRKRQLLSRGLVVAEVALSLALVTSTGLLLRSLSELDRVDLGFETDGIVTFGLEVPSWGTTAEESAANMQSFIDAFVAVPGVRSAAFSNRVPLGGGLFTGTYRSEEMVAEDAESAEASFRFVTPDYFETMGTRLLAGRRFRAEDGLEVSMLDEIAAERLWPGEDPIGKRMQTTAAGEDEAWSQVVGIVSPMKHASVREDAVETVFLPMLAAAHRQNARYTVVRVAGEPSAYVQPLRDALRGVDQNAVIARVQTMDELFERDTAATRFATMLLTVFGAIAVLLAAIGLHGVMAFSVRRRSREIGIRVALGAQHGQLLRDSVTSGAILVVGGIVLGIGLSLGLGRVLQSLLFEVQPTDVLTLAGSAALILLVGLFSCYLPSRLVLTADPAQTLREE